jgi:cytochrome c5
MNSQRPAGPQAVPQRKVDITQADRQRGEKLYSARCASCHSENGQGDKENPPAWGAQSFNDGAGLANFVQLASWLKVAMPLDETDLTDLEALDVAAFVNLHKRPAFRVRDHLPGKNGLSEYNCKVDWYAIETTKRPRSFREPRIRPSKTQLVVQLQLTISATASKDQNKDQWTSCHPDSFQFPAVCRELQSVFVIQHEHFADIFLTANRGADSI